MSEIKPAGYLTDFGEFKKSASFCDNAQALYSAAAYEALENERDKLKQNLEDLQERFNGIKFIEFELRKDNDSLNAEVFRLKNELITSLKDWHDLNANNAALQKENDQWKTVLDCNEQIRVGQAKRIADLFDVANDHRYAYIAASKALDSQKAEIESLHKQSDEMLTAMRRAVLALAFAAETSAAMKDDYNALSAAIDKVVAANKGDKS